MNVQQNQDTIINYHYDAFLSYRHLSKDKKVAIQLQKLLEKHKRPDGKMLRVFRDQSEFSASNDLGADIRRALAESRYLVVICSSAFKDSKWCMEEITYFRQLQGKSNRHILTLLIEGEPKDSIPEQLKWEPYEVSASADTLSEIQTIVEPLFADIRATNERKMLHHLRTEYLRIAAPLLDCSFDSLYQRAQRQKHCRVWISATAITVAAIAFSGYNFYMMERISQKQQELYSNESQRLSVLSDLQCENGDYCLAMLLAGAALPENIEHPERPLLSEAEEALRNAVTQRIESESYASFQIQQQINFDVSSWVICGSYDEGRKLAVSDYENTYLYDVVTGMLLFTCQGHEVYFNEDATRAAWIDYTFVEDGEYDAVIELYTTEDGKLYFTGQYARGNNPVAGMWEEETDCCYILYKDYKVEQDYKEDPEIVLLDVLDASGERIENASLSHELEEQYEDGYLYSYFDPCYYLVPASHYDYTLDGEVTDRALGLEELLLQKTVELQDQGYTVHGVNISDDRELALFIVYSKEGFYSYGDMENMAAIVYSLKSPDEEEGWIETLPGSCYLDQNNGLIYQKTRSKLCILAYHPENFTNQGITDTVQRVSTDGKLGLGLTSHSSSEIYGNVCLQVWETDSMDEPLLKTWIASDSRYNQYLYYTTVDMDFIFLQTKDGALELWSPEEGLLRIFYPDMPSETITSLTVNKDGTLVAYSGIENGSDNWVEIRSVIDGKLVQHYDFSQSSLGSTHLEFNGNRLLVTTEGSSRIYDLDKEELLMELPYGSIAYHYDCCLTEDGLLFSTMRTNKPCELSGIYDIETGKRLFGHAMYFQYNPKSGVLVYQSSNNVSDNSTSVHVASRNKEGQFEDIYVFSPDGLNMHLQCILQYMDEQYFLLNGSTCCGVYDIYTGNKVLTLNGNTYILVDGVLYDQRLNNSGVLLRYPIMELDELKEKAQYFLTSELGTRELTQAEKERYFIP